MTNLADVADDEDDDGDADEDKDEDEAGASWRISDAQCDAQVLEFTCCCWRRSIGSLASSSQSSTR